MGRGLSNGEIAETLVISEVTVKSHIGRIFTKLDLRDRAAAIVYAFDRGLVSPAAGSAPTDEESAATRPRGRMGDPHQPSLQPSSSSRERAVVPQVRAAARSHRPGDHPQLLHHRPHRPRQVDAGGPDAAADRRGRRAQRPRAVPRPDGHRARARHHDQEPGRADAVDGAGRQRSRAPSPATTC